MIPPTAGETCPRGLPGHLPPGERILWQGAPEPAALGRRAFHARGVAIYFALLAAVALGLAMGGRAGLAAVAATVGSGVAAVGLLHLLGWAAARTTVYTLTERRLVLRIGMALPTSINLPLSRIASVDLSNDGDVALRLTDAPPLGWVALWPHARPWRLARPEPMLRCLPDAGAVAARIARACLAAQGAGRLAAVPAAPARAEIPLAGAVAA